MNTDSGSQTSESSETTSEQKTDAIITVPPVNDPKVIVFLIKIIIGNTVESR